MPASCFAVTEAHPIDAYIPQRGAARLIDRVIEVDPGHAVVEADVPASGPWVRGGAMPSWAGIELMAQAVATWAGARARRDGRPVSVGFLLGTRRYEIMQPGFACGSTLRISAKPEFVADNGLAIFDCRIDCAGVPVARARLSVFEPADPLPYLEGRIAHGEDG